MFMAKIFFGVMLRLQHFNNNSTINSKQTIIGGYKSYVKSGSKLELITSYYLRLVVNMLLT